MDIEKLRDFCLSLEGTTEDLKWGDNLCFMIEEKIFVLCNLSEPLHVCVKVNVDDFDSITSRNGVQQAFHMAKRHWVSIDGFEAISPKLMQEMILNSRALVLNKLPKKLKDRYK